MKNTLLFLFTFILFFPATSQTIIEKKVIYSVPETKVDLTNGYGVALLKGAAFDNTYSANVEVIDLKEKGYLLRSKYIVMLLDNDFKKICEHDLNTGFIEYTGNAFHFYPSEEGIWLIQDQDGKPKSVRLALLSYSGNFSYETITFPEKYEAYFPYYDDLEKAFKIYFALRRGSAIVTVGYIFTESPANFNTVENPVLKRIEPKAKVIDPEEKLASITLWDWFVTSTKNALLAQLTTQDIEGNTECTITGPLNGDTIFKSFTIKIPEYANLTTRGKAALYHGDFALYVDEKTHDFFIFHTVLQQTKTLALVMIKGNLKNDELKSRIIKSEEFAKYGLTNTNLYAFSASNIFYNFDKIVYTDKTIRLGETMYSNSRNSTSSDETIYKMNDYYILDFHTRDGWGNVLVTSNTSGKTTLITQETGSSGLTVRKLLEIAVDENLEIVKTSMLTHSVNCLKHRKMKMAPVKEEILYNSNSPGYKPQEFDLIYSDIGKVKPGNNLYHLIQKNGFSYIFNFKEENSEVEVWKVKF